MDLSKLSLAELKDLSARIAAEEKKRAKEEVEAARNEIYAIAHRLGMPLKDLIGNSSVVRKPTGKVAVQYRNPRDSSQEWSGRGRQPNWFKELVASGADLQTAKVRA
jgi:DNA-binding protein H-NS